MNINYLKVIKLHIGGYGLEMLLKWSLEKDRQDRYFNKVKTQQNLLKKEC